MKREPCKHPGSQIERRPDVIIKFCTHCGEVLERSYQRIRPKS